ncbi:MAG: TolC family outer membrane protein [Magnetococcus sp. YQC-9]
MKRGSLTSALVVLLAMSQSTPAWSLTLGDAVNEAMRSNPKLLAAGQELEETRQKIRQAFAGYLPTVDFNMGTGREWTNTATTRFVDRGGVTLNRGEAGLNINQPLFDGFNTVNKVDQARAQVQSADYSFLDTAETVTQDVALVYAEVQKQRKLLELAKEAMSLHSEILVKTRQTIKLGITAEMDARLTESRVSLIASELAATEGQLRAAESRFATLVGFPPGDLEIPLIDKKYLPTERADALETALNRHPSLLSAKADLEATRAESKASAASLWPKISLEMAMSDSNNVGGERSYSQDAMAMVRFKYNLFRGGADSSKLKESAHKAARFRDKLEEVRNQVEEKVNRSWNALIASRARLQNLEKHVETMRAVHRDRQEQYRLGSQTMLDFLNSEHELQAARRLLVEEEFQFMMESFRLLAAMGLLKETLVPPEGTTITEPLLKPIRETRTGAKGATRERESFAWNPKPTAESGKVSAANRESVSTSTEPSLIWKESSNRAEFSPESTASKPSGEPSQKRSAKAPRKGTSKARVQAPPPADAPLTAAQEEAMNHLVEALFQPEAEQNASLPLPAEVSGTQQSSQVSTTASSPSPEERIPADEARAALVATAGNKGQSSSGALNQALDALAKTVENSSEIPPAPFVSEAKSTSERHTEANNGDGERVPPKELAKLMSHEERTPTAKYPPMDLLQYTIQIGAFSEEAAAVKRIGQLQAKGYDLYLQEIRDAADKVWYRVSIGRLENEREAYTLLKEFTEQEGSPGFVTPVARQGTSTIEQSLPFVDQPVPAKTDKGSVKAGQDQRGSSESSANQPVIDKKSEPQSVRSGSAIASSTPMEGFAVQVGAFRNPMDTEKRLEQLSGFGFDLYLNETRDASGHNWQLIWIGRFDSQTAAQSAAEAYFQKTGEAAQVIPIRPSTPEDPQLITRIGPAS